MADDPNGDELERWTSPFPPEQTRWIALQMKHARQSLGASNALLKEQCDRLKSDFGKIEKSVDGFLSEDAIKDLIVRHWVQSWYAAAGIWLSKDAEVPSKGDDALRVALRLALDPTFAKIMKSYKERETSAEVGNRRWLKLRANLSFVAAVGAAVPVLALVDWLAHMFGAPR